MSPSRESSVKNREVIDLRVCTLWVDDENITHQVFKEGAEITVEDVKTIFEERKLRLINGPGPIISDIRKIKSTSKEARDYGRNEEAIGLTTAFAIIVGSPLTKAIGTIFLHMVQPPYPTRLFKDKKNALSWVREFEQ